MNYVLLGSTGSIGENALRVLSALGPEHRVAGLAARSKVERLIEQAVEFRVPTVAVGDPAAARRAEELARPHGIRVLAGESGVCELAALDGVDIVLSAMVGMSGLKPTMAAVRLGRRIALANKEVLVAAGGLVTAACRETGSLLVPVDSEHSAIFQALQDSRAVPSCVRNGVFAGAEASEKSVRSLVLTASGGPFALRPEVDFERVKVFEALNHPRWAMGPKVTVDSATMMNKGLEIMEAGWLFNVPVRDIEVVVHPQSIIHSMVTFIDGSTVAQLAPPDMRYPIQYAFTWPQRCASPMPAVDLPALGGLTFGKPDEKRFPCLRLAREAMVAGGTMPAVLNAADEVAVAAFLAGRITFAGIWRLVEAVMSDHRVLPGDTLEQIFAASEWAKSAAEEKLAKV